MMGSKFKERALGEVFNYKGKDLVVTEQPDSQYCIGCHLLGTPSACASVGSCTAGIREDEKNVIFKEYVYD